MTDVTQEDWIKADETCVALLPTMPFDTDLGAFRESLAASFAAHRIAAEHKGMMEAAGIARDCPNSWTTELIADAIRQRATAIETAAGADHDR